MFQQDPDGPPSENTSLYVVQAHPIEGVAVTKADVRDQDTPIASVSDPHFSTWQEAVAHAETLGGVRDPLVDPSVYGEEEHDHVVAMGGIGLVLTGIRKVLVLRNAAMILNELGENKTMMEVITLANEAGVQLADYADTIRPDINWDLMTGDDARQTTEVFDALVQLREDVAKSTDLTEFMRNLFNTNDFEGS